MSWSLYFLLSLMMFLEFAVWGAWLPVLAPRLFGPLKMTGKKAGWILAALPIACIAVPLAAGQVADRWVNTEWILAGAHLVGAVLLFLAALQRRFVPLLIVMLLYSVCYAATLPLVNSLMFAQLRKVVPEEALSGESSKIFLMAPIAWFLVGWLLTGYRHLTRTENGAADGLVLGGLLSVGMGVACLFLPATPPVGASEGAPILKALALMGDLDFLLFIVLSAALCGMMQFYFMGTGPFIQAIGFQGKYVSGTMGIAQAAQAIATFFALGWLLGEAGYKWTLVLGALSWLAMYVIYVAIPRRWPVALSQALHGVAYALFVIGGQVYAGQYAPSEIGGSVQALVFTATMGVGLLLGTLLAGPVMDRNTREGSVRWRGFWIVPLGIMLAGTVILAVFFRGALRG